MPDPVEVLALVPLETRSKSLARLTVSAEQESFDGNARLFRLGVEVHRLGLASEYDETRGCIVDPENWTTD